MAQPYVGEIRMFGGNFAPAGWMFCSGQLLPISENETLFQLIGTTYGGDGQSNFGLPNLQSRIPLHQGNGLTLAEQIGTETVTLTVQQIPIHTHPLVAAKSNGTATNPSGNVLAGSVSSVQPYVEDQASLATNSQNITPVGGSQPHDNIQPYLCISFIISLFGIFPTQ
ncbi:MAG: tail fiber protein [Acidobacteriota bacterium]